MSHYKPDKPKRFRGIDLEDESNKNQKAFKRKLSNIKDVRVLLSILYQTEDGSKMEDLVYQRIEIVFPAYVEKRPWDDLMNLWEETEGSETLKNPIINQLWLILKGINNKEYLDALLEKSKGIYTGYYSDDSKVISPSFIISSRISELS